jgi:hypothetical protein
MKIVFHETNSILNIHLSINKIWIRKIPLLIIPLLTTSLLIAPLLITPILILVLKIVFILLVIVTKARPDYRMKFYFYIHIYTLQYELSRVANEGTLLKQHALKQCLPIHLVVAQ